MQQKSYEVWLVCQSPECGKLFPVPAPYDPNVPFSSYELAEQYAEALKAGSLFTFACGAADPSVRNSLERLIDAVQRRTKPLPYRATCPHCQAVFPLKGIRHVIKELREETD